MKITSNNKTSVIVVLIFTTIFVLTSYTSGSAATVSITIPTFRVTINDEVIDNTYSKYPLIVYRNITYFPMTYYGSRFLGITTKWDQINGLEIQQAGSSFFSYESYLTNTRNLSSYRAAFPTFNIRVNGRPINNAKEEYPLLIFRGVTYFPLTWRFAVEEFGWEYKFSPQLGLVINSFNNPPPSSRVTYPIIHEKETILNNITYTIRISFYRSPEFGNLSISTDGKNFTPLGSPHLFYGVTGRVEGVGVGFSGNHHLEIIDGWIHLFASDASAKESGLYRVNILTGETLKVRTE